MIHNKLGIGVVSLSVPFLDVDELVVRRKKMNKVFVQKFGSLSPHVAHLRHDEDKYIEVIKRFFKLAIGRKPN